MLKMSSESKTIKPKSDIELVLNYSNQCIWKNEPGAGANAACRINKPFPATDPLSEIIWSPDNGFSLKCVDSSFTNKNTSLFGNVEPSSMVLALFQSVNDGISTTDKPLDDVFVEPIAVICSKSDVSSRDTPAMQPESDSAIIIPDHKTCEEHHDTGFGDNMEKMNTARETPNLPNGQKENVMNELEKEKNIFAQANIGTAIISEIKGNKSTISGQVDERPVSNLLLQEDEPKCSMEENPSPRKHCNGGIDTGVVNHVIDIEDGLYTSVEHAFSEPYQMGTEEMTQLCNKNLPAVPSPCNSMIHMTRNDGKEKSLSDGNSNDSLSKEDDFHLSVESCHSAGLFLAGKKRCNFHQVIIGRKKVKKQIQETSCSKSNVKPDSSFMNLISNMMKGCSQTTQDEDKSLALNLENPNHLNQRPDQKLLTCNKNQDPELKNAGFRSNFQSMVGAKFKNVGTRMSHVGEASKDFELDNKVHGIDVTPITFYAENNSLYRQNLQSNKLEVSEGRVDACPPIQPQTRSKNSPNSDEHWKNNSVENETCYNLGHSKEKEGMTLLSLHSPSTRRNRNNNMNVESYALYERKEGLWITRFLPKSTSPLIVFDHLNERSGSEVHSTACTTLPHSHEHISLNNCKIEDQLLSEAKSIHDCCMNREDSTSIKVDKGNQFHPEKHKFNSFTPFPGFRDSGPMVSMFARRLGAIKQCSHTE
ncbi:uncharacterized protein LOC109799936 isoform X2 [Cajanus cajan]|uniref:uncharacterized protein LOC109799936 isoform X2 n=1 Tax=Cajanus cajan TaxID=3821 RepID=UPI00098D9787|nr:uncharacterized protein LOC109799936 isoform X2 [Cajanus cajan]